MPAKHLPALCAKLGLPMPAPDALGSYVLDLQDGYAVTISPVRQGMDLTGEVAPLPELESERDKLCREILTLSLGRTEMERGAALPRLLAEGKKLLLRQTWPADISDVDFESGLEKFLNLLEKWKSLSAKEHSRQLIRGGGNLQGFIIP
jgi:hypothetical protein